MYSKEDFNWKNVSMKDEILQKLEQINEEAALLLSQNEGIHNMYGARYGIRDCLHYYKTFGEAKDFSLFEHAMLMLTRMRICDRTKKYPFSKYLKREKREKLYKEYKEKNNKDVSGNIQ